VHDAAVGKRDKDIMGRLRVWKFKKYRRRSRINQGSVRGEEEDEMDLRCA
jgi:hypothetical protein